MIQATSSPHSRSGTTNHDLSDEWLRLQQLVLLAEMGRGRAVTPDGFAEAFDALSQKISTARAAGSWQALAPFVRGSLDQLDHLNFDILALALASDVCPSLGPRLQALQPSTRSTYPTLALLQEVLMLDNPDAGPILWKSLCENSVLVSSGLIRIEREGEVRVVRPAAGVATALMGVSDLLGPPFGAHQVLEKWRLEDLVLPHCVLAQLKELVSWIRFRPGIVRGWGARPSPGPLVLFSGGSGVGKTIAASAIAHALEWPLYSLDLGAIISKYVGETEQNMNRLLDSLHQRPAVLQIDEAEGLIGRRGDISDARDRYANLEVSHLLSRFERHSGPVILTTNLRTNIDTAFLRRFNFVVDFPSPDNFARRRLWRTSLPPLAPLSEDFNIDLLGDEVPLSGGAIQNAAFLAAVYASADGAAIGNHHVARALWRELSKENRPVARRELGRIADYLSLEEAS